MTAPPQDAAMRNCPFCGAEPAFHANDWCDPPEWSVYCPQCLARSAGNVHQDAAVAAWNRRAEQDDGWQPIETAPKSGKWVQLWWEDVTDAPFAGYYATGGWHAAPGGETWPTKPTHWRPLPTPPKAP